MSKDDTSDAFLVLGDLIRENPSNQCHPCSGFSISFAALYEGPL
jgi:hypothetical protein